MAMTNALDYEILDTYVPDRTKCAILNALWDSSYVPMDFSQNPLLGDGYMRYYTEQCRNALARHTDGLKMLITTHQDIVDVVCLLKDSKSTREDIKDKLRGRMAKFQSGGSDELLGEAIDLSVRLWLMIDVGEMMHSFVLGQKPLLWENGLLKTLLEERFTPHIEIQERVKLDRIFNARNLERIAGLQIIWTSNLADHLQLTVDDTRIAIFHHASFLKQHTKSNAFPPGFVDETLRTLALLVPRYDKKSGKWFRIHRNKWFLDEQEACGYISTEERRIENFVFWHDRLVILKQVFDEAEPSTIAQWWCDRRRRVQWYTFWVAALVLGLTVFFGTIQCLEGGLQVYKAYYPS